MWFPFGGRKVAPTDDGRKTIQGLACRSKQNYRDCVRMSPMCGYRSGTCVAGIDNVKTDNEILCASFPRMPVCGEPAPPLESPRVFDDNSSASTISDLTDESYMSRSFHPPTEYADREAFIYTDDPLPPWLEK